MLISEIEEFAGKSIDHIDINSILLWISQKYPKGIKKNEIIELNKELSAHGKRIPGEYASIYQRTIIGLEEYLRISKRVAKNHSVYTAGAIRVALGSINIHKDDLVTLSKQDAMSGVLFGHSVTDWLYSILLDQEEAANKADSKYYLFSKTKTGRPRRLQRREITFFENAMTNIYMSPQEYKEMPHLWGRATASFHYSYPAPPNRDRLVGQDVFLAEKGGYSVAKLIEVNGNEAVIERGGTKEIVSKYLIFNLGNRNALDAASKE